MVIASTIHRPARAGETSGSVELGMQQTHSSNTGTATSDTESRNRRLNLDYSDYLYRPWLLDYRIGGTLSETAMDRNTAGAAQQTETRLTAYRFNGKLFPYSPFPFTMYAMENNTDVTIQAEPDSQVDTRLYGADLKLDFFTLPTTNLFYYGQTTKSNLSSILSEQDSHTGGINMFKRWDSTTANLRYENSDYSEKYSSRSAAADRFSGSLTYRPSDRLQGSYVFSDYQRDTSQPNGSVFDPLYSDRDSRSHNLSLLWNPTRRVNIGLYGNYFLEDYASTRREAKDGRANLDVQLSDHMSAFVSAYELQTRLSEDTVAEEQYNTRDDRGGLSYNRAWLYGALELQARLSGGVFDRRIENNTETEQQHGNFYQTGGRLALNLPFAGIMFTPYYDINVGYNQQSNIHATRTRQQDTGFNLDGSLAGGRLNANVSYMELEQDNDLNIRSEQFRSYLSYEHRVLQRAMLRLTAGRYYTKGYVENNTYEAFTSTEDTETRSSYRHVDFSTPVFGTNILCTSSYRREQRASQDGLDEDTELFDIRFSHQFGKLFSEAGFMKKHAQLGEVESKDTIWFIRLRRDFSFGHK